MLLRQLSPKGREWWGNIQLGEACRKPSWKAKLWNSLSRIGSWCVQGSSRAGAGEDTPCSGNKVSACRRHTLNAQLEALGHIPAMGKGSKSSLEGDAPVASLPESRWHREGRSNATSRSHACSGITGLAHEKGSALPEVSAQLQLS